LNGLKIQLFRLLKKDKEIKTQENIEWLKKRSNLKHFLRFFKILMEMEMIVIMMRKMNRKRK
jgi:hypothetical protein